MLYYIEHTLYKLENTKIAFEYYRSINSKLCQPTFNYPKFHIINHFVQYIWDYDNIVNSNTTYNKTAYKYLFKTFYNRTKKKDYDPQI